MTKRDWIAILVLALMLGRAFADRVPDEPQPRRPPLVPEQAALLPPPLPLAPGRDGRVPDSLPTVERDGVVTLERRSGESLSTGSAFPIDGDGLHATAFHVVQGCETVMLADPGDADRFRVVEVAAVHPSADLALIRATADGSPLSFSGRPPIQDAPGFHYGFPSGRPGAAASRLLGRSHMRTTGVRETREPVLVWARQHIWPEGLSSLGGASGGPTLDASGAVVGVTIAEDRRRGRIYSAAPETFSDLARTRAVAQAAAAIDQGNWLALEQTLRTSGQVRRVLCLTGRRFTLGQSIRLRL